MQLRSEVKVPAYDRGLLRQHTVHMGVGGFHRAHQAVYLDDLLALEHTERWGECGLGVLRVDNRMRDALGGQDCLFTVVERSAAGQTARVIGSLVKYIYVPESREAAIERMAAPDTRIVSLTITEGGYFIDEGSGQFLADHPDIQHDLHQPTEPVTSMGLMAEALDRRRERGLPPFTVMSCDNLQGNGDVVKKVLVAFAGLRKPALERWIATNVAFPNSMVDRITPATTVSDIESVSENFGIEDAWPVVTEPFRQWVIEDTFSNGRPQWELVGAQLISDVAPYEIMKMRLLNGSHLAMAYLGALHGFTYVHEVMDDSLFYSFIQSFMEEVTPVVPRIPGVSVTDYKRSLLERFSNPTINDQVTRICSEGSAKLPKRLLPSAVELTKKGTPIPLLSLVVASWIFYLGRGIDERGEPLNIIDARAGELRGVAKGALSDPRPMLNLKSIFGEELPANPNFVLRVERALQMLSTSGVSATIRNYLHPAS
jgi:mannitol 2-dehydrogenase